MFSFLRSSKVIRCYVVWGKKNVILYGAGVVLVMGLGKSHSSLSDKGMADISQSIRLRKRGNFIADFEEVHQRVCRYYHHLERCGNYSDWLVHH